MCIASFIVNRMTMLDFHIGFFMKTEGEVNLNRYYLNVTNVFIPETNEIQIVSVDSLK